MQGRVADIIYIENLLLIYIGFEQTTMQATSQPYPILLKLVRYLIYKVNNNNNMTNNNILIMNKKEDSFLIRRYLIVGERRLSNYLWAILIMLGSFGFLYTGLLSYIKNVDHFGSLVEVPNFIKSDFGFIEGYINNSMTLQANNNVITFFPQGLLMCFYGSLGFLLSFYWWFLIFLNVGGGFNEFNKKEGFLRIYRWGYPGRNRRIDFSYPLKDIESIVVISNNRSLWQNTSTDSTQIKESLNSPTDRTIYVRLKGKRQIPLTGIDQPLTLKEIEKQASELANFLQISLEGL